jgi:hypothetical protein
MRASHPTYNAALMRRWIAILLLLLLPLQAVWAAAAPYCGHEQEPSASVHLGHHEHEHQDSADTPQAETSLPDPGHADCHTCHGSATMAAFAGVVDSSRFGPEQPTLSRIPALPSPVLPRPERPNWSSLA